MPTYGYRCKSCEHTFEVVQSVNDEPIKDCPECKGSVSKIFYPVGIAFKGSGFHVNDYKSPKRVATEKRASDTNDNAKAPGNGDSGCSACQKAETCTQEQSKP